MATPAQQTVVTKGGNPFTSGMMGCFGVGCAVALVFGVLFAGCSGIVGGMLHGAHNATTGEPTPGLAITTVNARVVNAPVGHCPSAVFDFTGVITTNGDAGSVTYQWIQPDGTPAQEATQSVSRDQTAIPVSMHFIYKGQGEANGAARLKVLSPSVVESNQVTVAYRCP